MFLANRTLLCVALLCATAARADWADYRGPWGIGYAAAPGDDKKIGLPIKWSESENVKWKTPIPHKGWSSPIIMGKQIWLTTATEDGHDFFVICADTDSGKILFNEKLFHSDSPEPLGNDVNSYASPSATIEPGRVYVHFGSYGTACLDTKTFKTLWKREDLQCRHFRGPGSSPILYRNLLILTMDGIDLQYLTALDKQTGKTIWKTNRTAEWNDFGKDGEPERGGDFRKTYTTPLIVESGGVTQMISPGSKAAYAYDPMTGREIWKINHSGFSCATRAVTYKDLAFFATGSGKTEYLAVRMDSRGTIAGTNVVWRTTRSAPRLPSPVVVGDLLYLLADSGVVRCVEAATGDEVWQERIGGEYYASLLYADGNIYAFNQDGKATVLKPGRKFEIIAANSLAAGFMASPAVDGKALILRTKTHLYRIEAATTSASAK